MLPTLSKQEKIRALLIKQIEAEKEEIADLILQNDNDNLEFLYNAWVKRQRSGKINLSDLIKSERKKYEQDENFKEISVRVDYDFPKFNYNGDLNTEVRLRIKLELYLYIEENDKYGRDYTVLTSSDYGDTIDNSIKQLEMAYNAHYNPITSDTDIEITV